VFKKKKKKKKKKLRKRNLFLTSHQKIFYTLLFDILYQKMFETFTKSLNFGEYITSINYKK